MTFAPRVTSTGRRVVLTERAQAGELLREPLVDLAEVDLGVDIGVRRDRPRAFGEPRARDAEGFGERGDMLGLDREARCHRMAAVAHERGAAAVSASYRLTPTRVRAEPRPMPAIGSMPITNAGR